MGNTGFFKGEKKKTKKGKEEKSGYSTAPVFTLPRLIEKKKKNSYE